jgi:AraC-like DNA-binding protein
MLLSMKKTNLPFQYAFSQDHKTTRFPLHFHEEIELFYVIEGTVKITNGYEEEILRKDTLVIFNSNTLHATETLDKNTKAYILQIDYSFLKYISNITENLVFKIQLDNPDLVILKQLIKNFFDYPTLGKYDYINQESIICKIIYQLCRSFRDSDKLKRQLTMVDYERICSIDEFIQKHFDEVFSVNDVAINIGLSPNYFSKYCHRVLGKTFSMYLCDFRLERARDMIKNSTESLEQISNNCGFFNYAHFCHCFKRNYGETPSYFRKNV